MGSRFFFVRASAVFGHFLISLSTLAIVSPARAADLPRYKLKPGMELIYRSTDAPKEADENGSTQSPQYTFDSTIDVIRPSDAGGWRLLVRQKMTSFYKVRGKESKREHEFQNYVDIDAEGRMIENRSVQYQNPAMELFPPLPRDEAAAAASWQSHVSLDDTTRTLTAPDKAPPDGSSSWHFVEHPRSALDPIYLNTTERDYTFDAAKGLVTRCVSTYVSGWPERRKGQKTIRTTELVEVRELPAAELASLADESGRFFAAFDEADRLTERASRDFAHTGELFDKAEERLKELEGKLTNEALKNTLEAKLKSMANFRKYEVESAEKFCKLIGQPSAEWETTDLDGSPRKLTDYRGKVVLLDFWYRGCGFCIRAMPQIKQLAADFDGQSVAILGMNNDNDLADARFVIDTLKLPYENLKNSPDDNAKNEDRINGKYEINGWPTLVMLDGKGVIRHIHVGYSANLREELAAKIRELLAEK